jgi:hypothetical protein
MKSAGIFQDFFQTNAWKNRPRIPGLGQILEELEFIFSGRKPSAEDLRNLVATASPEIPGNLDMASGRQQDIEEFLRLMLEEIEQELLSLGLSNIVADNFKCRDKIVKKFLGEDGTAGVCPNCLRVPAETHDNFSVLRLPVPKRSLSLSNRPSTLAGLISRHYSEEKQEPMRCQNCCNHQTHCSLTGKCKPKSYTEQRFLIKRLYCAQP